MSETRYPACPIENDNSMASQRKQIHIKNKESIEADFFKQKQYCVTVAETVSYFIHFIFDLFRDGCPSTDVVFQGALRTVLVAKFQKAGQYSTHSGLFWLLSFKRLVNILHMQKVSSCRPMLWAQKTF